MIFYNHNTVIPAKSTCQRIGGKCLGKNVIELFGDFYSKGNLFLQSLSNPMQDNNCLWILSDSQELWHIYQIKMKIW